MVSHLRRIAASMIAASVLGGCAAAYDPDGFLKSATFWHEGAASDKAMAALAKGDYAAAELHAHAALRRQPDDPHALLVSALVYHNTNRPELARKHYEAIIALRPQAQAAIGTGEAGNTRNVVDIARANLAALSGEPPPVAAAPAPAVQPAAMAAPAPAPSRPAVVLPAGAEGNMLARFVTLRRLLDDGLMTEREYLERRSANLGALLPFSASPPADRLDRPPPAGDEVVQRLAALAKSFEMGAISAREHAAERMAILEAVMPAAPAVRAAAAAPSLDAMAAAAAVGRLERLREAELIGADELTRERDAIFRIVQPPGAPGPMPAAPAPAATVVAAAAVGGPQPLLPAKTPALAAKPAAAGAGLSVHLASLRSEAQAMSEWQALVKRFPKELGALQPEIARATVPGKGEFFRLKAGPLPDRAAAEALCRTLKQARQYCDSALRSK